MLGWFCEKLRLGAMPPVCGACLAFSLLILPIGCTPQHRDGPTAGRTRHQSTPATTTAPVDAFAERLQSDPVAALHEVLDRAEALDQYRLTFYRQERLGGRLHPQECIRTLFRREPFSVKFIWDDPGADYYESFYVAGQNDNKLVVRERRGALPFLPPTIRKVNPETAVQFARACHPVTSFGLANLVRRTLAPLEDPQARPHITIRYQGLVHIEPLADPVHHLRIERPPTPGVAYIAQDFYIDPRTHLPAGADLYQPGGDLAASYRYTEIEANVRLTDADFQLSKSQP